jgi:hypothetical protein
MGLFRHPHLIRGVVHTSKGSFAICRGVVDAPDEVGESYGWIRVDDRGRPDSDCRHTPRVPTTEFPSFRGELETSRH